MRIVRVELLHVHLPMRHRFAHARAQRQHADNLVVRVETSQGIIGHGEGILRDYLTGETPDEAWATIADMAPRVFDWDLARFEDLRAPLTDLSLQADARARTGAFCPLELAILDAAGRHFGCAAASILGPPCGTPVRYSGVISSSLSDGALERFTRGMLAAGLDEIKIKVGDPGDVDRVRTTRSLAGPRVDLRVDANGAWSLDQALATLPPMRDLGITSVEQPLAPAQDADSRQLREALGIPVVADESLLTSATAGRLVAGRACDVFNVRLAKCGGMLNSHRLVTMALAAGLQFQVGCLVGETGLLSAAGRQFAHACPPARHYEGSYGSFLFERDLVREDLSPGPGGAASPLPGPGLGVTVDVDMLAAITVARRELAATSGRR